MKKKRQEAILNMIEKEEIGTQEELMLRLKEKGYDVTQATISRDIKSLKLIKSPVGEGQYRYSYVPGGSEDNSAKYYSIISSAVTSVNYAGNMVVIKSFAGMAQAACAALDTLPVEGILGTIAGDDTIFALCENEERAHGLKDYIANILIQYK